MDLLFLLVLSWWLWCRSRDLLLFDCFTLMVMVSSMDLSLFVCFIFIVMMSFNGSFVVCLFYLYSYGVVQWIFCFLLVLPWWLWCRSRDLLLFACFTFIVMVSFKGSFVFCLFYLYSYGVVQIVQGIFCCLLVLSWWLWCRSRDLLLFACFTLMVMVSFKGSFVVCLFYLDSYGVVQGIFCFLFFLPWWLWCRSRELLLFACLPLSWWLWCRSRDLFASFILMVMVSFKGSFVVCLFYLYGYGVVQGIFCFLLVLSWWLWCRSRDLLLFDCFTFMVMVSFKGYFVVCLFYLDGYGVVQWIFCCLLVLPWWLWCRSRDLSLFACFILIVMVSFNGSFIFCLFYLDGYGVVQGSFLLVLSWWLWCRSWDLLLFDCFTCMVMVSFKGSFVVCLFYLDGYGVVQWIFCCLLVLPWWLWCRSRDLLLFVCFILMVMVSFKGSFVVCLFYLYSYGVVQGFFGCLLVLPLWLWCRSRDRLFFACFI